MASLLPLNRKCLGFSLAVGHAVRQTSAQVLPASDLIVSHIQKLVKTHFLD